jgi:hypothetical protein
MLDQLEDVMKVLDWIHEENSAAQREHLSKKSARSAPVDPPGMIRKGTDAR